MWNNAKVSIPMRSFFSSFLLVVFYSIVLFFVLFLFWFSFFFFFLLNKNQSIWPRKMKLTITFPTTYMYALIIEVFFVWADTKSLPRRWCMHFSCRSFLCLLGYKLEFQHPFSLFFLNIISSFNALLGGSKVFWLCHFISRYFCPSCINRKGKMQVEMEFA